MRSSKFAVLAGFAGMGLAFASPVLARKPAVPERTPSASAEKNEILFSRVVDGRTSGLERLDFAARTGLRVTAEKYIAFRKKKLPEAERKAWIEQCRNSSTRSVFCREQDYLEVASVTEGEDEAEADGSAVDRAPAALDAAARAAVDGAARAASALATGDAGALIQAGERTIRRTLRRVSKMADILKLSEAVEKLSPCGAIPLNTVLAQKAEEFLPDAVARDWTLRLHGHAASCGTVSEWTSRSKYRLSLLLIAQGDWARAEKWLGQLSQDEDGDYFSRSLYWRARAARMRGDQLGFEQAKARLLREFPIHYHSLLLGGKRAFVAAQNLHQPEPVVSFESAALGAPWNDRVRAIEVLQEKGATEYARPLFSQLEAMMDRAEPEARLYLVALQNRSLNAIGTFRAMSSVMRDHPSVLSRETLSLLFPLDKKHRDILYRVAGGGLDPYIIAALIRQESGFVSTARSPAGALGLMQLMPATARRIDRVSRRELLDGRTNVRIGVKFFKQLLQRFDGKVDLALAAYNAGPERVDDWRRRYQVEDPVLFDDLIPFRETRDYVSLISRNYYWYLQIYARHIFDERLEAARAASRDGRRGEADGAGRKPAASGLSLEFSLFSAH